MMCSFKVQRGKIIDIRYDGGSFYCDKKELITLKGCPKKIEYDFNCSDNKLTNLKGCPQYIERNFSCYHNKLTTLKGGPKKVGHIFNCSYNHLTSLEGFPEEVEGCVDCSNNQLTNLTGCLKEIKDDFNCSHNKLASLENGPKIVNGFFDCSYNYLKNLKGCPQVLDIFCNQNPILLDISDIPTNCEFIRIDGCPNIQKFPQKIDKSLTFFYPTRCVKERIKEETIYQIVNEDEKSITVRQKTIGENLLDSL